jgi:hypothetical protein
MNQIEEQKAQTAATAIMVRMNRVTELWEMLDRYAETGVIEVKTNGPVRRRIDEMSRGDLIRFFFTIHPTITKLKKRLAAAKDEAKKAELQAELMMRQAELEELYKIRDGE